MPDLYKLSALDLVAAPVVTDADRAAASRLLVRCGAVDVAAPLGLTVCEKHRIEAMESAAEDAAWEREGRESW